MRIISENPLLILGMNSAHAKLRERVKELNCLYAISKVAWQEENNIEEILAKLLHILPKAMQFPALTQVEISLADKKIISKNFLKSVTTLQSPITLGKKKLGLLKVGYTKPGKGEKIKPVFLTEEKKLVNAVSRELALYVKRSLMEEDKRKLQLQLQHVERLAFVGELTAGIAHELNEPLAGILGFAQLISKTGNLNKQQSEDIERIVKASLYTREIIKKLMIFSRQMPQQFSMVNLNEIIKNILYFIDVRFQSKGIKIQTNLFEKIPLIKADEVQMSQVLVNLITNAVHAMPHGGDIFIKTFVKNNRLMLSIKDTGNGMTPEIREKIFEPFFTTKPVGQGTGLGLSVVQGIIDAHHGKISVSSSPGKGTKFEIALPITKA